MPDHLFVYGTLRGESSHPMANRLRVGAKHVGRGSARGSLYDFGDYPGAVFDPGTKYRVIGDVFEIKAGPRLLADLDKYEGVSEGDDDMYRRIAIEVTLDQGGIVQAWAYGLKETPRARLIGTGDFIADRRLRGPKAARP
jgi:gamma-glutamylcyclotransferase (GGCT)/AIG2-like uncharacterized protein YtfP